MKKKTYYWLKLGIDFFGDLRIKKLRKLAGGDTYTLIYLKAMLYSLEHDGVLTYTGLEPTFADELALQLDEEPDNVAVVLNFLLTCGLMEDLGENEYLLPEAVKRTDKEGDSAARVRAFRERKKAREIEEKAALALPDGSEEVLHCNADVTKCNTEKEKEKEISCLETGVSDVSDVSYQNDTSANVSAYGIPPAAEPMAPVIDDTVCHDPEADASAPGGSASRIVAKRSKRTYPHDSMPYREAQYLAEGVSDNFPGLKSPDEKQLQSWADELRKLNELDGYSWRLIEDVMDWALADAFWCQNIRSGNALRRQFANLLVRSGRAAGGVR